MRYPVKPRIDEKTAAFLLLLCAAACLRAQELKVSVTSGASPLGYAYVYINGKIFSAAGGDGVTYIPTAMLHQGDSVSASFVGAKSAAAAYEKQTQITLDLAGAMDVGEVVVTKKIDPEKYFRRMVNRRRTGDWLDAFGGGFSINNNLGYSTAGEFYRAYLPARYIKYMKEHTVKITAPEAEGDSLYRSEAFFYLAYFFGSVINAGGLNSRLWFNEGMVIKYMGPENGTQRFFLTRPKLYSSDNFQTIIYVDAESKEVVRARGDLIGANSLKIEFEAEYKVNVKDDIIYPGRIDGTIYTIGNQRWDIGMQGIEYDDRHRVADKLYGKKMAKTRSLRD